MSQPQTPGQGASKGGRGQDWTSRLQQFGEQAKQNLPDGAVTPAYRANREEVIDLLNRALASEWASFLQYHHHYIMASDIHSAEIRQVFEDHANEEREHAGKIAERIDQLGGVPVHSPQQIAQLTPTPFAAGHDLHSMLEIDLVGERETIMFYNEIVRFCGFDDNETRAIFEDFLLDENEHANEIANLLYQQDASGGELIPNVHDRIGRQPQEKARGTR